MQAVKARRRGSFSFLLFFLTAVRVGKDACIERRDAVFFVGIWALRAHEEARLEAPKVDSLKPRKCIHLALVDYEL